MNRRRFLTLFATAAAVAAVDPERLLWTPGARTHFLAPEGGWDQVVPVPLTKWQEFGYTWEEDYVLMTERMTEAEFRARYANVPSFEGERRKDVEYFYHPFEPIDPKGARFNIVTTPDGHEHAWLRELLKEDVEYMYPRSETDRKHAEVLQQIVDRMLQAPEIRARLADEIRHDVFYGHGWRRR
jgi:hypothetical protein